MKTNFVTYNTDKNQLQIIKDFQAIHDHGTVCGAIFGALGVVLLGLLIKGVMKVKELIIENKQLKGESEEG